MTKLHSFHIPVMGIGFSIETPLKVSQYGIDSVISLVDDHLFEKLRKVYCDKYKLPYEEIGGKTEDFRAKRITAYLNLTNDLVKRKCEALSHAALEKDSEVSKYIAMLPDRSTAKQAFKRLMADGMDSNEVARWVRDNLSMGSIDVNIMTKLDKENYVGGDKLSGEHRDAHAALRGYANSDLASSIVLSAGMNPRLYSYMGQFEDFYPDENGVLKKKIVLKVSDYRSASIQGRFLAKKGLWVSEYRIESGLNCGGHAFATDGYLMGPILAEFRDHREELIQSLHKILVRALSKNNRPVPKTELQVKITAQGGVGTAEEHQFLLDHYQVDSVGWATPFLLVAEATAVDELTRKKLADAKEDDLYLSNISPLGVPFSNLRGNTKDLERQSLIDKGRPGSGCPKRYLVSNTEFTERAICTASRQYQQAKLKELDNEGLSPQEHQERFDAIVDKSCICVGLGTASLLVNHLDTKAEGDGVSICPGPNMAYFSRTMSLTEITDHIYGRANSIARTDRPNMFIQELRIYIDYLKHEVDATRASMTSAQEQHLLTFVTNLMEGIDYYCKLFAGLKDISKEIRDEILSDLDESKKTVLLLKAEIGTLSATDHQGN